MKLVHIVIHPRRSKRSHGVANLVLRMLPKYAQIREVAEAITNRNPRKQQHRKICLKDCFEHLSKEFQSILDHP